MDVKSFDCLPFDVVIEIFQYLSFEELVSSVQYVNKQWQNVIQDPIFWKDVWYKPPPGIDTETVVSLLQKAPLLRAFEFRECLKAPQVLNALCEHNCSITSLAFGTYIPSKDEVVKLLETFPNLEYLQITLMSFMNNICTLGKFPNLRTVKCTQVFHEERVFNLRNNEQLALGDEDWSALEVLEMHCEHTDENFAKLLTHVKKKLHTLEIHSMNSFKILKYIPNFMNLQRLKLNFLSRQVQNPDFETFFPEIKNLTKLKYLNLTSFVHADENVLCKIFKEAQFPMLTELELRHCLNFSSHAAQSIAAACRDLRVICLQGCVVLKDSSLCELSRCRALTSLDISGCVSVTEKGLSYLTSCCRLRELNLNWIGLLSLPMLEQIAKMKKLSILHLDHTEANLTNLLDCLKKLPTLQYVSVYRTNGISGKQLQEALPYCTVRYDKRDLSYVLKENSYKMETLRISGAGNNVLTSFSNCEGVKECSIDFLLRPCNYFPHFFSLLKTSKMLQSLNLTRFVTVESGLLCRLFDGGLPHLKVLELEHCFSVDEDVALSIAHNFPQLEILRLKNCVALNDNGIASVAEIKNLKVLDITDCCEISESGLLQLIQCKHLKELNVCGILPTATTEKALNCILSLPDLCTLYVDFSDSTDAQLKDKTWYLESHEGRIAKYKKNIFSE